MNTDKKTPWNKGLKGGGGRKRVLKDKKCPVCGKLFRPQHSLIKHCSYQCSLKNKPKKGKEVICSGCGKKIYRPQSQLKYSKHFCKKSCRKGFKTDKDRTCKECGKKYYVAPSQARWRGTNYCSVKCKNKGQSKKYKKARHDKNKYPKKLAKFKKWVWKHFSDYIRERDKWTCYTCGKHATGSAMHAGHFIPSTYSATKFDEMNVHAQCYSCNIWKRGNAGEYSIRLIKQYGKEKVEAMVKKSRETHRFTREELEDLYEMYKPSTRNKN